MPDTASPVVTVLSSVLEGGVYDDLRFLWVEVQQLTGKIVPSDTGASARYTPNEGLTSGITVTVLCRLEAIGEGINATDGSVAHVDATIEFEVGGLVPPELAIKPPDPLIVPDHLDLKIIATEDGGNYDTITREWSVDGDVGSIVTFTPPDDENPQAVGLYTPPEVEEDTEVTVVYTVTVQGTGVRAPVAPDPGVQAFAETTFTVRHFQLAEVPEITLEGPADVPDNSTAKITAMETGGFFDQIIRSWQTVGETLNALPVGTAAPDEPNGLVATYTPPKVSAETEAIVRLHVTAIGEGRNAADQTSADAEFFHRLVVFPFGPPVAPQPTVSGEKNILDVETLVLTATESTDLRRYDRIEREWTVERGTGRDGTDTGTLTPDPTDENKVTFSPPNVDEATTFVIRRSVKAYGDGVRAEDLDDPDVKYDDAMFQVANQPEPCAAPTVSISGAESIRSNETLQLVGTEMDGVYDEITRRWDVVKAVIPGTSPEEEDPAAEGSINSAGLYTPGTVPDSETRTITVRYAVTIAGTGIVAVDECTDGSQAEETFDVVGRPCDVPTAPTVEVTGAESIKEGEDLQLTATVTKGEAVYDSIESEEWIISRGGGTFDPDTPGLYRPPNLDDDETKREIRIRYVVVVIGDGNEACAGQRATAFREVTFDVVPGIEKPAPTAPTPTVTGGENIREFEYLELTATWSKGTAIYDVIDSEGWEISVPTGKATGRLSGQTRTVAADGSVTATATYHPGDIDLDDQYEVTVAYQVTVSGNGTTADADAAPATGRGSVQFNVVDAPVPPDPTPPTVIITASDMKDNETQEITVHVGALAGEDDTTDGDYGSITFEGFVADTEGTVSVPDPTDPRTGTFTPDDVEDDVDASVTYEIRVRGDGITTNADPAKDATVRVTRFFYLRDANGTRGARAPNLEITDPPDIGKTSFATITVTEDSGIYETFESTPPGNGSPLRRWRAERQDDDTGDWIADADAGSISQTSVAPSGRVRARYTPSINIIQDTAIRVTYEIVVKGFPTGWSGDPVDDKVTRGSSDTNNTSTVFIVKNVLEPPEAPELEIGIPDDIDENTGTTFTARETGGRWDFIDRTWGVSNSENGPFTTRADGGTINATTGQFRASSVTADTTVWVRYHVRVTGDGTTAEDVGFDTAEAVDSLTVKDKPPVVPPLPTCPGISVRGAVTTLRDDQTMTVTAVETGGTYDRVKSRGWEIVLPETGGGDLDADANDDKIATYDPPTVSANLDVTLRYTVVVEGTGQTARADEERTCTATVNVTVTPSTTVDPLAPPTITLNTISSIDEGEDHTFTATESGGNYDSISRSWSAERWDPSAGTSGEWVSSGAGSITTTGVYTAPSVSADTRCRVVRTVTVTGTGVNAAAGTDKVTATEEFTVRPVDPDETTETDSIYIRATSRPATPTGGTDDEDHLPTNWSRTNPGPTATEGVWESQRTLTYTTGSFRSATTWETATEVNAPTPDPVTVTQSIYINDDSRPATPAGGTTTENHLPSGWRRTEGAATAAGDVWRSQRDQTTTGGAFTSATAWGTPTRHLVYVPPKPNALAPTPTITNKLTSIDEDETHRFTASESSDGIYDTITRSWSAERLLNGVWVPSGGGSFSGATYTPPDVSSNRTCRVIRTISVTGTGDDARNNTSNTRTDTDQFTVRPVTSVVLPPVTLTSVTITASETSVRTGETVTLGRTIGSGSVYDDLDTSYSGTGVSGNTFTAPAIADGTTARYTVSVSVTASSDGTTTDPTSPDVTKKHSITITVVGRDPPPPRLDRPTISVTTSPATASIKENEDLEISVNVSGDHDASTRRYAWSGGPGVISGSGTRVRYTPPSVGPSGARANVYCRVYAKGDGTTTDDDVEVNDLGTTRITIVDAPVTVVKPNPSVRVTVSPATASIKEGEDQDFTVSYTGTYDDVDSIVWSSNAPGGHFDAPSVTSNQTYTVSCRVTVSGDGNNAASGKTASDSDSSQVTVINVDGPVSTKPACNISVSVTGAEDIKTNEDLDLDYDITGDWDNVDSVSWSASQGSISSSGSYTPPSSVHTTGQVIRVTVRVTASGDGGNARNGTSDTKSDSDTFVVYNA